MVELFDTIYMPYFMAEGAMVDGSEQHRMWKELLHAPARPFRRGGEIHQKLSQWRDGRTTGTYEKLHTTCYLARPPPGFAGDEYTWYICDRTRQFIEMGHRVFRTIYGGQLSKAVPVDPIIPFYPHINRSAAGSSPGASNL